MIISNSATCRKCKDFIFSRHVHDFVTCKCGAISVDGGQDYLRRVGDPADFIESSFSLDDDVVFAAMDAVKWARESGRNDMGIANAVIRSLYANGRLISD
jgi:hypothetical protein